MNSCFQHIPLDIVIHILQFDNKIKYRNGKFMNQISEHDERSKLLYKLPLKYIFYMINHVGTYKGFRRLFHVFIYRYLFFYTELQIHFSKKKEN